MGERNSSILLIHDDPELLDSLTDVLEGAGFEVAIAGTAFAATNLLEERSSKDEFDAVVAGWGTGGRSGLRVYCWVLEHQPDMRSKFVFLADEEPLGFKTLVKDRCPLLKPNASTDILQAVYIIAGIMPLQSSDIAIDVEPEKTIVTPPKIKVEEAPPKPKAEVARPKAPTKPVKTPKLELPEPETIPRLELPEDMDDEVVVVASPAPARPTLLLVEDDPLLLKFMVKRFSSAGFIVTSADGGNEAIQLLDDKEYDVILADWYMSEGTGEDIYEWLLEMRPELLGRCFFMSGSVGASVHSDIAPKGCRVFPKGQDADQLIQALLSAAREARDVRS